MPSGMTKTSFTIMPRNCFFCNVPPRNPVRPCIPGMLKHEQHTWPQEGCCSGENAYVPARMGALQMDGAGCFTIGDVPGGPGAAGVHSGKGTGMKTLTWVMVAAALCMGAGLSLIHI